MAYVKIELYKDLLESGLASDGFLHDALVSYFPTPLRAKYADAMRGHRLRREIIATQLANAVINRGGMTFVHRLGGETGADAADLVRAWSVAGRIFRLSGVTADIEALDNQVSAALQVEMLLEVRKLGERATRWLLRQRPRPLDIEVTVTTFAPGIAELEETLTKLVGKEVREKLRARAHKLRRGGVGDALAERIASHSAMVAGLDIIEVATGAPVDLATVAAVHFQLADGLGLNWLMERINALPRDNNWQSLARAALRDDLTAQQRLLTADALQVTKGKPAARVESWMQVNEARLARLQQLLTELRSGAAPDFTMLSVALRELRALATPVGG